MTRDHRPRTRRATRAGIAGAVLAAVLAMGPATADARPKTTSATIASEAAGAVEALERWQADQNPADYVRFVQGRDRAAALTATDLEVDGADLVRAWAAAPVEKQHAVLAAMSQLGVPYRYLKADPEVGFDCSGLTLWAYGKAGVEIPRSSRSQIRAADDVERDDAEPGDLVYYPGHISMYLGVGTVVHSPNTGSHVEAITLTTRRSLDFGDPAADD